MVDETIRTQRLRRVLTGWAYPVLLWLFVAALFAYATTEDYWRRVTRHFTDETAPKTQMNFLDSP